MHSESNDSDCAQQKRVSMLWHLLRCFGKERDRVLVLTAVESFESLSETHVKSGSCIQLFYLVSFDVVLQAAIVILSHEVAVSSIQEY